MLTITAQFTRTIKNPWHTSVWCILKTPKSRYSKRGVIYSRSLENQKDDSTHHSTGLLPFSSPVGITVLPPKKRSVTSISLKMGCEVTGPGIQTFEKNA